MPLKENKSKMKKLLENIKAWLLSVINHKLFLPFLFTALTMICMPISVLLGSAMFGIAVNYFVVYVINMNKK